MKRQRRAHCARRPCPAGAKRQRGIALLTAVLLVALATIIATAIAYESGMSARRGTAVLAYDQSLLAAQAAEALAAYGLKQDNAPSTLPGGGWAQPFGPAEVVPGVTIEAVLEDMTARFNLNSLITPTGLPDPVRLAAFRSLLRRAQIEPEWADKVVDWLDPDVLPYGTDGAEDQVYTGLTPPYRPPNMMVTSVSELLALPGFGRDRYLKLAPYVAALPRGTQLNVCTADPQIIDAMLSRLSEISDFSNGGQQQAEARKTACVPSPQQVASVVPAYVSDPTEQAQLRNAFGQKSSWFRLTTVVTIGTTQFTLYSLLYRNGGTISVVSRSQTPD